MTIKKKIVGKPFNKPTLIVLLGPTGVGKTDLSLSLAHHFGASVVSSDSRQIYKELHIGVAAPSESQLRDVPHYFIKSHSIFDYYSAGRYELDALPCLERLFRSSPVQLLVGGSMLYIDAVCKGFDDIPHASPEVRAWSRSVLQSQGIDGLLHLLRELDPQSYERIDRMNTQRVLHAVEVSRQAGIPYSRLLGKKRNERPFNIIKIGLNLPREVLYDRINRRVDQMMDEGLELEARSLYPHRQLNALNTVGYKELFLYFSGEWTFDYAVTRIKQDTRRYAKRQLTWFNADPEVRWFSPEDENDVVTFLDEVIVH